MCRHIFDWTQRGIETARHSRPPIVEEPVARLGREREVCVVCQWWLLKTQVPRSLQPACPPSLSPSLSICSSLHLLQSAGLRLKVNTEVTAEAARDDRTDAD